MPHIVASHSQDLANMMDIKGLLHDLTQQLAAVESFDLSAIKARALPFADYFVAGKTQAFLHLEVAILAGRSPAVLDEAKAKLAKTAQAALPDGARFSLELREMNADLYYK